MTEKIKYKVTNWKQYNRALVDRGNLHLWINDEILSSWEHPPRTGRRGRPANYSDSAIECMLTLRSLYRMPLRMTQGLFECLLKLMGSADVSVPDYTTLCRRQKSVATDLETCDFDQPLHVLVDSTGLKVYGEGEWKTRKHGFGRRRVWRKLHLVVDAKSHRIICADLTNSDVADCERLEPMLLKIDAEIEKVGADGAYDTWECRYAINEKGARAIVPPRENAVLTTSPSHPAQEERNQAIEQIRRDGRPEWKKDSDYHKRSLVETAMFRVKRTFGAQLQAEELQNQISEVVLKSKILNEFIKLGMPETVTKSD